MSLFAQNDLVQVSRETEVTPGTVVGGGRTRVYGTAPTWTAGGSSNTSGINTGDGGIHSVRAALRYADAEIPSELVFALNDLEFEDQMRDEFQGTDLVIGPVALTFNNAGTHVDGSTGPIITAASGTFDDVYDTDHVGLLMKISGAAVGGANKNWHRRVKAVKSDGTQIDIDPIYCAGSAAAFREPLASQSAVTGSINFGQWIRNQGIQLIRSINLEFDYTDIATGSFDVAKGLVGNGLKIGIAGKGNITLNFMYTGMDYNAPATASIGSGTTANDAIENKVMTAGDDLLFFAINGSTLLSAANLTSYELNGAGNAQGIDDVSGNRFRPGVTVGDIDFTGSLKIYHKHVLTSVLNLLGRNGNLVPHDWMLQDPAGNGYAGYCPQTLFEPNAAKPGAKGSKTDDSINFKTCLGASAQRTFLLQRFAA